MHRSDRRREPRFRAHRPLEMVLPDGSVVDGKTEDLSSEGLRIHTRESLPAGIQVNLKIPVDESTHPVALWSHVQHCHPDSRQGGYSLGVRHHQPPTAYLGLLRNVRLCRWRPLSDGYGA